MNRRSFVLGLLGAFAATAVIGTNQAEAAPAPSAEPVAPPMPESEAVDAATQAKLDTAETADSQYYYRRRYYRPVRRVYYRRPVRRVYYRRPVRRVYYRRPVRRVIYRIY